MSSVEDLAKLYSLRIHKSRDQFTAAGEVADTISTLKYSKTDAPISGKDRQRLIQGIEAYLKEADNRNYLELVSHMLQLIDGST